MHFFVIVLGATTTSSWLSYYPGDQYSLFLVSLLSSWGPLPTSLWVFYHPVDQYSLFWWVFYHPGDHYLPLRECSIILGTNTHFLVSLLSSWGPLPTSLWVFYHPGDQYSLFWWVFYHPGDHYLPLYECSIILRTTNHLFMTVQSFGDHSPTLQDRSVILWNIVVSSFLTFILLYCSWCCAVWRP